MDSRLEKLADVLVNHSTKVKPSDKVLIETFDCPDDVAKALIKKVYEAGAIPYHTHSIMSIRRELLKGLTKGQIHDIARYDSMRMQEMQCYIAVRGVDNTAELSDVANDKMELYQSVYQKQVHTDLRVKNTRWVVTRYPNNSMAQHAGMSTEAFEDFYFKVCTLNYAKMDEAMKALQMRMRNADIVTIKGVNTDLSFSILGIPAKRCAGDANIPDGEIYTAPVRDSVNGKITFNAPSVHHGFKFEDICFEVSDGKIVKASANDTERLNSILNTDQGARYFGEFAFGINPYILNPMLDTLFDEKIAGSIHLTPGSSYEEADNGNRSAVHWDLVYIQRPEFGGGEIWFDDELIRKDGKFVPDYLQCLNPENLI